MTRFLMFVFHALKNFCREAEPTKPPDFLTTRDGTTIKTVRPVKLRAKLPRR